MGQVSGHIIRDPEKFWDDMIEKWGDRPEALCWSTKDRQEKRFEILFKIITEKDKQVLDLGCGTADFFLYLKSKGWSGTYAGIDISQKMLDIASKKIHRGKRLIKGDIIKVEYGIHDYVILSGTLNHRFFENDVRQYLWAKRIINKMWRACKIGMAFNMRSAWGWSPVTPEIFAYNPSVILGICRDITSCVVFDHSYFPHDFTISMFKEEW